MRFGGDVGQTVPQFTKARPVTQQRYSLAEATTGKTSNITNAEFFPQHKNRVYTVQRGDTLKTIAKRQYGRADMWTVIRTANAHLLSDPNNLEVGQKLILPARVD